MLLCKQLNNDRQTERKKNKKYTNEQRGVHLHISNDERTLTPAGLEDWSSACLASYNIWSMVRHNLLKVMSACRSDSVNSWIITAASGLVVPFIVLINEES